MLQFLSFWFISLKIKELYSFPYINPLTPFLMVFSSLSIHWMILIEAHGFLYVGILINVTLFFAG